MARFSTYGQLDSQQATEGDRAFVRFISRINPEQLQPGELAESYNGRMDNDRTWQTRKGWNKFFGSTINGNALRFDDNGTPPQFDDAGTPPQFTDNVVEATWGTCYMADPVDQEEYLLVATNANATAVNLSDGTETTVYYPGDTIDAEVEMLQALDNVFIFRDGETAWYFDGQIDGQTALTIDSADLDTTVAGDAHIEVSTNHGLSVGDWVTVAGVTFVTTDPNGTYRVATVPTAQTFSYDLTGASETYAISSGETATLAPSFAAVASGTYTQPTSDDEPSNLVVADSLCTITETAHGRSTGDILTVYDGGDSGLVEGDRYEITKIDADSYSFRAEISDGTSSVAMGGKQPVGGGYIHMPDPAWAIYHEGRLIMPYARSLDVGTSNDEIIFSDIFDFDTYDPILNQLRFGSGSADYLVGLSPLLDDRLVVFNRRSIHLVRGISGGLADITQDEITREIGCVARRSIVEVGGTIMWLSDQGVYSITYGQELNLIANSVPMSEPIENEIRQINWEYASQSVAAYADNRYYLAVPWNGRGPDNRENNTIFVYNFLNQGWESIDTLPEGFDVANFVLVPYKGRQEIFAVTRQGAIHRIEQNRDGADVIERDVGEGSVSQAVEGRMVTRRYTGGTLDTKRWSRYRALVEGENGRDDGFRVSAITVDPEIERVIEEKTIEDGEDYNLVGRISRRGFGAQLKFETKTGKVRSAEVEAMIHGRSTQDRS